MTFQEDKVIDNDLPNGWKSVEYSIFEVHYDAKYTPREMAILGLKRMVEREPNA